ncbi:MAG: type 1 glutamine amidotransferase domain-containing protein [Corynebacterium sp.]|uniref:type 1 glutamine amidotransferase domain-containing protein n=1 Tax=unclassified Corynebacterium TaxID=2624378 RepID=UPI0026482C75|nr:type 1 glutamine amidotransferase domain-containing protein [Corynebacterium sp.]MDN5582603.1 type 1 glutamine amidotransferase [Corynebacterium sp.]MDN5720835.1 type 1 glutamine amidotransferase [Corynebacterium sp.]MDN6324802.1 type 1 glutamine amidotransferase [Corynebacterium sp.]
MSDQKKLTGRTVVVLATDGFEDSELTSPRDAVSDAGAHVVIATPGGKAITGKKGTEVPADARTADVEAATVDAVLLPGGTSNADALRLDADAVALVREVVTGGKPLGVICHGAWILTDADVLSGRTLTSYPSLRTDLVNAGATWVDEEAHTCGGPEGAGTIVSSRTPDDLPAFNDAVVAAFAAS